MRRLSLWDSVPFALFVILPFTEACAATQTTTRAAVGGRAAAQGRAPVQGRAPSGCAFEKTSLCLEGWLCDSSAVSGGTEGGELSCGGEGSILIKDGATLALVTQSGCNNGKWSISGKETADNIRIEATCATQMPQGRALKSISQRQPEPMAPEQQQQSPALPTEEERDQVLKLLERLQAVEEAQTDARTEEWRKQASLTDSEKQQMIERQNTLTKVRSEIEGRLKILEKEHQDRVNKLNSVEEQVPAAATISSYEGDVKVLQEKIIQNRNARMQLSKQMRSFSTRNDGTEAVSVLKQKFSTLLQERIALMKKLREGKRQKFSSNATATPVQRSIVDVEQHISAALPIPRREHEPQFSVPSIPRDPYPHIPSYAEMLAAQGYSAMPQMYERKAISQHLSPYTSYRRCGRVTLSQGECPDGRICSPYRHLGEHRVNCASGHVAVEHPEGFLELMASSLVCPEGGNEWTAEGSTGDLGQRLGQDVMATCMHACACTPMTASPICPPSQTCAHAAFIVDMDEQCMLYECTEGHSLYIRSRYGWQPSSHVICGAGGDYLMEGKENIGPNPTVTCVMDDHNVQSKRKRYQRRNLYDVSA